MSETSRSGTADGALPTISVLGKGQGGTLDVLRFAAAMMIVLYHYGEEAPVLLRTLNPVFGHGYLATDFFLMLSGYVLGRGYGARLDAGAVGWGEFLKRRLTRIWPAHLIVLAAMACAMGLAGIAHLSANHPGDFTLRALALQALLVQAWGFSGAHGWNEPSWSLSAFVVCYAAFPLIWRWSRAIPTLAAPGLGLGVVIACDAVSRAGLGLPLYDLPLEFGLLRAMPLFLLGALVARATTGALPGPRTAWALTLGGGAVIIVVQALGRFDALSIAAIAAVIAGCSRPPARPSRAIAAAAKVSFALFITHIFTAMLWLHFWRQAEAALSLPLWFQWAIWGVTPVLALAVAAAFDRFIDAPVQRFLARPKTVRREALVQTPRSA